MDIVQDLREFIITWNNTFPTDKWWRDKYKIPFGSPAHLEANQIDIFIEYIEQKAYEDHRDHLIELDKKKDRLKKEGIWITISETPEDISDEDFENAKIEI
jgi:transposase